MNNLKPTFALVVICSLFIPSISFSRQVEDWSYERLFKESDLVVIAHVQAWGATDEEWNEKLNFDVQLLAKKISEFLFFFPSKYFLIVASPRFLMFMDFHKLNKLCVRPSEEF